MGKQAQPAEYQRNSRFISSRNHVVVPHRTARLNDIARAAAPRAVDIIPEGEESVGTDSYIAQIGNPGGALLGV